MTIPQAFQNGLHLHQSGRLAEAEALYWQILAAEPRHADALHCLGVIAHQAGRNDAAVELLRQAIAVAPDSPACHSNLGEVYRMLGRLDEAEAAYRRAIELQPAFPDAYCNLAIVLTGKGRFDEAILACRRAIELRPNYAEAHSNLGAALSEMGRLEDSLAACRRALQLKPDFAEAHANLGRTLAKQGRTVEAIAAYRLALQIKPDIPEAHSNLGNALRDRGLLADAILEYRRAITIRPDFAEAHGNLGATLGDDRQFEEAIAASRQAIALKPDYPEAHHNLGVVLHEMGHLDEAIAAARRAIALRADYAQAWGNLGAALHEKGDLEAAIAAFRQALAFRPDDPVAICNLGVPLRSSGHLAEAIAAFRQALAIRPDYPDALNNLGNALKDAGRLDEALDAYRQALAANPAFSAAHSNLLFAMNYHPGLSTETVAEEHRRWDREHVAPFRSLITTHANHRAPERRLRIGYVSPDFRRHPVGHFLLPLLAAHDRSAFEIFCYAQVPVPDAITEKLRAHAAHWRNLTGLSAARAAECIREDRIDILVDLSGHTAHHRLDVFACKPAPIQVTWLGYPNTTGLDAMDFRLTDSHADPAGQTEHLHSERLIRLDPCAWCFLPPQSPPLNERKPGAVTFGCFNNFAKITGPMLSVWAQILHAVPGSRLLLKARSLTSGETRMRVLRIFGESGIAAERLELRGHDAQHQTHLALYGCVDIALDTYPYHGTTTTCEALWMGVPVITLAGKTHASRVGVSLLTNSGLPELIAHTESDYVRIATSLANDAARLSELRATLRGKMKASPLMDAPHFALKIEEAFREMWRAWCATQPSNPQP